MKKLLLLMAVMLSPLCMMADDGEGSSWTRTGYIIPVDGWTGFYDSALGQAVTVKYDGNDIVISQTVGGNEYSYTITPGDDDKVEAMYDCDLTEINYSTGGYNYFYFGDSYEQFVYPYYDCYVNTDPETGYVLISAYFDAVGSSDRPWSYVEIVWWDGIEDYVEELKNPTAIKNIETVTKANDKIYDINGRQMKSLQKGVNIVNGKKVLVK